MAHRPYIVYRLSVTILHRFDNDEDAREPTAQEQRYVEKELFRDLQKAGYAEADCELLEYELVVPQENPREKGDDDGVEYGHPGDVRRGLED